MIFCGDLNVAHQEIDLKNPKTNRKNAGFTDEERAKFPHCAGMPDLSTPSAIFTRTRRASIPGGRTASQPGRRTPGGASTISACPRRLKDRLESADIHTEIMGSDHCPVELVIR